MSCQEVNDKVSGISRTALTNAYRCLNVKKYGPALAEFMFAASVDSSVRNEIESDFTLALRQWSDELISENRLKDLFTCYSQACEIYPNCEIILNNIGAQLFSLGYIEEAAQYTRKALKLNPDCLEAKENFENICGHLVERWHFRMLNDMNRNQAFATAIDRAVDKVGSSVLDIGTGTGLLSMIAVDTGASCVFACEKTKTMYDIATEVLSRNGMTQKITLINKLSTDLTVPVDLPQKVSMVVTETFDAGLFGEHILSTLKHAWENLLDVDTPGEKPVVIPSKANVFVCGIECDAVQQENRLLPTPVPGVNCSGVNLLCDTGFIDDDPYTTENLRAIPNGFIQLTEVTPLMEVDFNHLKNITDLLSGVQETLSCCVKTSGRLDALAVWFDLHLDDITSISTSPETENCWHQAIYPVFSEHFPHKKDFKPSVDVIEGDELGIHYVCEDNKLTVKCVYLNFSTGVSAEKTHNHLKTSEKCRPDVNTRCHSVQPVGRGKDSNSVSPPENCLNQPEITDCPSILVIGDDLHKRHGNKKMVEQLPTSIHKNCGHEECDSTHCSYSFCMEQSLNTLDSEAIQFQSDISKINSHQSVIKRADDSGFVSENPTFLLLRCKISTLNNQSLNSAVYKTLEENYGKLCTVYGPNQPLKLLNFSHGFSFVSTQALNVGFSGVKVFSDFQETNEENIQSKILHDNGLSQESIEILDSHQEYCMEDQKGHCLFVDLLEPSGILHQNVLEDLALMKLTCLASGGKVVPGGVSVYGILIESLELLRMNSVIDSTCTLKYNIADVINEFQMTTHVDIHLSTLPHRKLSEPFLLLDLQLNDSSNANEDDETNDSCSLQDVPSFLSIQKEKTVTVKEDGDVTALVYWFNVHFTDSIYVNTIDQSSHWKQAAIMIPGNTQVKQNQVLNLAVSLKNSCLRCQVLS